MALSYPQTGFCPATRETGIPPRRRDPPKETGSSGAQTQSCWKGTSVAGGSRAPFTFGRARRTPEQQGEWADPTQGLAEGQVAPDRGNSKETNQAALGAGLTVPRLPPRGTGHPGAAPSDSRIPRAQLSTSSSLSWVAPPAQAETPWGALGGLPANLGSPPRESPLAEEPLASPLRKPPFTHSQQPASARPQHSFDNWGGEELKS